MNLSPIAEKIFKSKYAFKDERWDQTCLRVATYVSQVEENKENYSDILRTYFLLMYERYFIPGGRVLANAGTVIKNMMNCFVLPVNDSRKSIYEALKNAAEIFANGGGLGYDFSKIREEGSIIKTTGGHASGPLSFMSLFDQTGEVIQQASRRGAQMGMLNVSHPDIIKFIGFKDNLNKRNERLLKEFCRNYAPDFESEMENASHTLRKTLADDQLTHFNISVILTDEFMEAVEKNEYWNLISRADGSVVDSIRAREILELIAEKSWASGDPGVFFWNKANEDNMVPYIGDLNTTNPCGEVPLLSYEPCCLGSINLAVIYNEEKRILDLELLEFIVRNSIRFLDNVQELSETPLARINHYSKGLRRLGLGVMGWADLLAKLEIPYDDDRAIELAETLSWFISYFGWLESIALAEEKGSFPLYDEERVNLSVVEKVLNSDIHSERHDMNEIRKIGLRNVSITSIAPTGSIALIADVNSSIEPFFALAYKRNITEGVGNTAKDSFIQINEILFDKLLQRKTPVHYIEEIKEYILKHGTAQGCDLIPKDLQDVFKTSHEIPWEYHIKHQAAWQKYTTNAVSKTINMSKKSTKEDIYNAIIMLWKEGAKGGTIYRDGSKIFQILNKGV